MGNEIVYCVRCRGRLLAADFERGKAVRHADNPYCAGCLRELAFTLPPEEAQRLLEQLTRKLPAERIPPETPSRGTPRKTSTSRIPVVKTERRALTPGAGSETSLVPYFVAGAVVLFLGAGAALIPSRANPGPRNPDPPKLAVPVVEASRRDPPSPKVDPPADPSNDTPALRREESARKALDKARAFGKTNPVDLPGRIALFEQAAWECRGTAFAAEARREHEALQKQRVDQVAAELAPIADKAWAAAAASHYSEAIALLRKEQARLPGDDWNSAISQKILQIRQAADQAFAPLRQKALQSRRRGEEKDVADLVERVRSWGLEDLSADLDAALAAVPAPAKPPDPDVRAYLDAWEAAFGLARVRDYAGAVRDLGAAAAALRDPAVKAEAAADLDTLRLLAAAYTDVIQTLARWPKGQKIALEVDAGGTPFRVEGTVVRQGPGGLDVKTEAEIYAVDVDDLTPACLRELLGKIPGRKPDADSRIGVLFPLLEGEPVDLSTLPAGALPPRIVSYGTRVAEERARPDVAAKESDARARFLTAERQFADPATRLQSFETLRALLASSADSTVVRRKRAIVAQRLEAEKEAGKEYVLYAEQMQAAGTFRRVSQPKAVSCWTSSADVPPEKENYVEFSFAARAATEYRCWVYVGGCCAETFAFDVQGTEMGADPGSANRLPVKNTILFLKKTHAQHGGRKEPTRFEWVAVPLPKYASAGGKTVRLISGQQGFSVAYAVVSAVRTAAPSDAQLKEWERSRPALATGTADATSAADPGLVGWWTLDEGTGAKAADSSSNHFSGTLRGNPVWTSGKRRGALSFDGQKDYVEIPKNPKFYLPGPFTVAAWVNVGTLPRSEWGMYLFADYSSDGGRSTFALRIMGTGAAQFFWQTEDAEPAVAASSGRLVPGTWAHVAGVWDGTTRMLYVNGVLDGTTKSPQPRPDIGGHVSIGRPGAYNGLYFSGRLDDVRIYSRALSSPEIRTLVGR
jgi:hypothetical protein